MMVWDFEEDESILDPELVSLRLGCARVLDAYKVPHAVWNEDALACHDVPTLLFDSVEVLVPEEYLDFSAERIIIHLKHYKRCESAPPTQPFKGYSHNRSITLQITSPTYTTPEYIILTPDSAYNFDVTDDSCLQPIPKQWRPAHFDDVRIPTHAAFLDALLSTAEKEYSAARKERQLSNTNSIIVAAGANRMMIYVGYLTEWKAKQELPIYKSQDDFPQALKDMIGSLRPENRELLVRYFVFECEGKKKRSRKRRNLPKAQVIY